MNLTDLANFYNCDKGTKFCECHNYTPVYESLIPNSGTKKLLEIGLFDGASTMMWQKYNPNLKNVVIDITLKKLKLEFSKQFEENKNVFIEIGDQSDTHFLTELCKKHEPFDYIIDDGSHQQHHIQISFSILFKYLVPGGIYFIEDLHVHNSKRFCQKEGNSALELFNNFKKTKNFESNCVNNEILNSYKNDINSINLVNNKLLVIKKNE